MTLTATTTAAELEAQIAEQRRLAEQAEWEAERYRGALGRFYRNKAAGHRQMEAGLISRRTDARVEEG